MWKEKKSMQFSPQSYRNTRTWLVTCRDASGTNPKVHMNHHRDLRDTWQKVAEWREMALAPRGAKLHDKLKQGTKELPPL